MKNQRTIRPHRNVTNPSAAQCTPYVVSALQCVIVRSIKIPYAPENHKIGGIRPPFPGIAERLIFPHVPELLQHRDIVVRFPLEGFGADRIMDVVQVSGIAVAAQRGFVQMDIVHADVLDGKT
jgi:hypothetical protein